MAETKVIPTQVNIQLTLNIVEAGYLKAILQNPPACAGKESSLDFQIRKDIFTALDTAGA